MTFTSKRALSLTVLGAIISVLSFEPAIAQNNTRLICSSNDYDKSYCSVGGTIRSVSLRKQLSSSSCSYRENWGYTRHEIWVDDGCRAEFDVRFRDNHSYNDSFDDDSTYYQNRRYRDDNDIDAEDVAGVIGLALLLGVLADGDDDDDAQDYGRHYRSEREKAVRQCVDAGYKSARSEGGLGVRIINPNQAIYKKYGNRSHLQATFEARFPQGTQIVNVRCEVDRNQVVYFHHW